MVVDYTNDGQVLNESMIKEFNINVKKDLRNITMDESEEDLEVDGSVRFVGFVTNRNDDMLVVFPKKFEVDNVEKDAVLLFDVINKHIQKHPQLYIGSKAGCEYESNFPFSSFFIIYEYYKKYGLYFEENDFTRANVGGTISWKTTIRQSKKYVLEDNVYMFPFYYKKKYYSSVFLTECMVFAIDYTIVKFNTLLKLDPTGKKFPTIDYLEYKRDTISRLVELKQQTFKDTIIELIDNLIDFFKRTNKGGDYYLKHYTFSSIWENMVMNYLTRNFGGIKNGIILDKSNKNTIHFSKPTFNPNAINERHSIQPDYYYANKDYQLILDAKYYKELKGINYKQVAYYFFLKEMYNSNVGCVPQKTYSALILPDSQRTSKMHFKMNEKYNKTYSELIIYEEYFDIRDVMKEYVKNL